MRKQANPSSTRQPTRDSATMPPPRLSVEQRSALALLIGAGMNGVTETIMLGRGFTREMVAFLARKGLATVRWELVRAGGRTIEVGRVRITAAGRRALES